MGAGLTLFEIEIFDSDARMALTGVHNFEGAYPFSLIIDKTEWVNTADRLARAGRRIEARLRWADARGKRAKAAPIFQRYHMLDDSEMAIELGIAAVDEHDAVYFKFGDRRVHVAGEQADRLLFALARFGEQAEAIFRASRPPLDPTPSPGFWSSMGGRY